MIFLRPNKDNNWSCNFCRNQANAKFVIGSTEPLRGLRAVVCERCARELQKDLAALLAPLP